MRPLVPRHAVKDSTEKPAYDVKQQTASGADSALATDGATGAATGILANAPAAGTREGPQGLGMITKPPSALQKHSFGAVTGGPAAVDFQQQTGS